MLFNSLDFAIFLPIVFLIYWMLPKKTITHRNFLIVVASYFFYGSWNWKFLGLIILSTLIDFTLGLIIHQTKSKKSRKLFLYLSILSNIGILVFFKYYNFFIENFVEVFSFFGEKISISSLNIILPVGISFYTFQTLSYTIDIYREKIKPTNNFIAFSAFVSFFPQLVAGPIERASNLLPQFFTSKSFQYDEAVQGLKQILWGLFKKMVVADNCAHYVNIVFSNYDEMSGSSLIIGAILFSFQIYGDFSGYSDIAIGTARLFGFKLMKNFSYPYFSRDIAEFWRRWHISLSTWFRDYLYIPLGGSKGNVWSQIKNVLIIFIVSGFWHGANWTFIVWGFINALFFIPLLLTNKNRSNLEIISKNKIFPKWRELLKIIFTFFLVTFSWIFFRSDSLSDALAFIEKIFTSNPFEYIRYFPYSTIFFIIILIAIEWLNKESSFALEQLGNKWSRTFRWSFYYLLVFLIIFYRGSQESFIYFQF